MDSDNTIWSKAFLDFCNKKWINIEVIKRLSNSKSPDFKMSYKWKNYLIELKDINDGNVTKKIKKEILEKKVVTYFPDTEKRIQNIIKNKYKQLKEYSKKNNILVPYIIIIYDNDSYNGIEYEDVLYWMYGSDSYTLHINNSTWDIEWYSSFYWKNKSVWKNFCNNLLCVWILRKNSNLNIFINNYFNDYINHIQNLKDLWNLFLEKDKKWIKK